MEAHRVNRMLAALSDEEFERVSPHLRPVSFRKNQVLLREGEPIQHIVFPGEGVCCLTKAFSNGNVIEIASVGAEGVIGAGVVSGESESLTDVVAEISDNAAQSMPVDAFKTEWERKGTFHDTIAGYSSALLVQLMQMSACNALHSVKQRCCRWLLTTRERARRDEFPMTHASA